LLKRERCSYDQVIEKLNSIVSTSNNVVLLQQVHVIMQALLSAPTPAEVDVLNDVQPFLEHIGMAGLLCDWATTATPVVEQQVLRTGIADALVPAS
jgi:hypothetical protein